MLNLAYFVKMKLGMLKISYYGHSCFKFSSENVSLVIDPYQGVPNLQMPFVSSNYCICSHNHADHNATNYVELIPTEAFINIEEIKVPHDHHEGSHRGWNKIHIFMLGGYKIAHFGDLGCIPNKEVLEKLKKLDIVLAPINGFYTISAKELKQIIDIIKPRLIIPMHYYRKENNSGYKDDNQIEIFKTLIEYKEVNDDSIFINENIFEKPCLIFNKSLGDCYD